MIDTKTISSGRVMYIGSELESTVKRMKDLFLNPAFIPVHQYADATTALNGEIGTIDQFRIVVVPEMLNWAGVGANVVTNPGYRATAGKYDVFPMLVVGDESFTRVTTSAPSPMARTEWPQSWPKPGPGIPALGPPVAAHLSSTSPPADQESACDQPA